MIMGKARLFFAFIFFTMFSQSIGGQPYAITGEDKSLQSIKHLCGTCHGLIMNQRCVSGECDNSRVHTISEQPWDLIVPWMKAMGCQMTAIEQSEITRYLMKHFGKYYPIRWERAGSAREGWNVVSLGEFHGRLYAGIEGSGSIFRLDDFPKSGGPTWKRVLETPNYTVYGFTLFREKFYAVTNDPAAEIWSSTDGVNWQLSGKLSEEKGITSIGVYQGSLYVGTVRASLYRSTDGLTWKRVRTILPNALNEFKNWVRFILPYEDMLYVGTEKSGLYRTEDGEVWTKVGLFEEEPSNSKFISGVRGAAVFNGVLYIGTTTRGEIMAIGQKNGSKPIRVFSADQNTNRGYVGSMSVFNNFLYAGIGGTVFRTHDGKDWEEVGRLGPYTIEAMAGFDHYLYAGTTLPPNTWIYRTTGLSTQINTINPPDDLKP
ncbi:MAG: hypothetical protein ACHQYP_09585 [Nitrospiria bacterium]